MVRKAVTRPHAGNENGKFTKENKLSVKKNEGGVFYFSNTATFSSHSSPRRNNCSSFEFNSMTEIISRKYKKSYSIGQDSSSCKLLGIHHIYQTLHLAGTRYRQQPQFVRFQGTVCILITMMCYTLQDQVYTVQHK